MQDSEQIAEVRAAIEESLGNSAPTQPAADPVDENLAEIDAQAVDGTGEVESDPAIVEEQAQGVEKLVDLAAQIGVDPAELYGLQVAIEDGGETRTLTIGELKDQFLSASQERLQIAQQREQVSAKQAQLEQAAMQQAQAAGQMSERMTSAAGVMKTLQDQYPSFEASWAQREAENPGQVALERQRVGERFAQAQAEYRQAEQEQQQQSMQARSAWEHEQHGILAQAVPEWADPVKRQKIAANVSAFVSERGMSAQQQARMGAADIQNAIDAMKYRDMISKAKDTVAGVKRRGIVVPKGMRVGTQAKAKHAESLIQQAKRSGRSVDKMAAARAIFNK